MDTPTRNLVDNKRPSSASKSPPLQLAAGVIVSGSTLVLEAAGYDPDPCCDGPAPQRDCDAQPDAVNLTLRLMFALTAPVGVGAPVAWCGATPACVRARDAGVLATPGCAYATPACWRRQRVDAPVHGSF